MAWFFFTNMAKTYMLGFKRVQYRRLRIALGLMGSTWAEHGLLHPGIFRCFIMDIVDIVPFESFTRHELPALLGILLVDGHMKEKLANVQEAIYSLVAPRELLTVASGYGVSCILYTDGS
jgi:hypothetical protein